MAVTRLQTVFGASPAVNDMVLAARDAIHQHGQTLGFKSVSLTPASFFDHRDVAKEMHGRWQAVRSDFEKKKLSADASIACDLTFTEKGLAFEFSASMGKNDPKPATEAPPAPEPVRRATQVLDIFLNVPVGLTASETAISARRTITEVAESFGLNGFTFPIRDHETQTCIVEDRAYADMHAQNVYYGLGFVRAPREPGLFLWDGRFVWHYQGHTEVQPDTPHASESYPPFTGLVVTRR